ncbi:HAMP domain-containing sensor histidine kinase [Sphaerisporangium sp. NPDC049002]|uniref:HAMP domain-containing sensor histidine kinase n=1 Tax=unclassified Sphaerisporangium TaxID=2630420 RepID=UPI0033DC8AF8
MLITALILVPMALIMSTVIQQMFTDSVWHDTREEASAVAAAIHAGRLPKLIVPVVPGIDLVQVVGPDRKVIAASGAAKGSRPVSTVWPSPDDPIKDLQTCLNPQPGCLRLTALRTGAMPSSSVVYAGQRASSIQSTGFIVTLVGVQTAALIALAGWTTWKVIGQTLRPVDSIRSQLAQITFQDLSGRVPQPPGDDEVAKLARTANRTLGRLEQAVQVRRQFVTDASHELRTPLAGLRLQLEEAQMHPEETELEELLPRMLGDVERLQQIVTDLLYLAGVESAVPVMRKQVDLGELVRMALDHRNDRLPTKLSLEDGVIVNVVQSQLNRALANLLDNAQRHAEGTVAVEVFREGDTAVLAVSDDGAGVADSDRERIFERFTRLDASRSRDRGGTGLGLAIARDVARAHAGTIQVLRSPSGGARFEVRLPLSGVS